MKSQSNLEETVVKFIQSLETSFTGENIVWNCNAAFRIKQNSVFVKNDPVFILRKKDPKVKVIFIINDENALTLLNVLVKINSHYSEIVLSDEYKSQLEDKLLIFLNKELDKRIEERNQIAIKGLNEIIKNF